MVCVASGNLNVTYDFHVAYQIWGGLVLALRILAIVFAVAVPIGIALQKAGHIELSEQAELTVWIVGLTVLGIENVGTIISRAFHRRSARLNRDLESALSQLLVGISKTKSARYEELGASIWVKKRFQPLRLWRGTEVALHRKKRFRPLDEPHQSGLKWTSRMGVVGECWRNGRRRYKNLWALGRQYDEEALEQITPESFDRLGAETQAGFTHREYATVTGKYCEVLATPIFSSGNIPKLIGVLSVDRAFPELGQDEGFMPSLNNKQVKEDIQVIVELIASRLNGDERSGGE